MASHAAAPGLQTQYQGASRSQHSNLIRLPLNPMECGFFEGVESENYVTIAKEHYLQAAAAAFPELEQPTVESVVTRLQQVLRAEAQKLSTIEVVWTHLTAARDAVRNELGDDPAAAMTERLDRCERLKADKAACDTSAERWESYLAQESIFYALFAWLPPVARKRLRLARLFLRDTWPKAIPQQDWQTVDQIENALHALVVERNQALGAQQWRVQRGEGVLQAEQQRVQEWKGALEPLLRVGNDACSTLADVDALADKLIRFPIFLLTTHYWEGRWLLEMKKLLPEIEQEKARTGRVAAPARWRRRMKLTPCIVSTFYMLPSTMKVRRHDGEGYADDYLYHFADLLIVDEAGQALPDVAGASFALAKRALIIGDTLQIEPIWSLPTRVDIGNLQDAKLIPEHEYEAAFAHLSDLGKTVSAGSVMRIAQCTTRYHADPELARGLYLYEHRRCFDEIIRYCNDLCYHGKLIPVRGTKAAAMERGEGDLDGLPAMGYLHVDGLCQATGGGSRHNLLEADTIAAWLAERQQKLEETYRKPLTEIVGVVRDCSESTGLLPEDVYRKVRVRTFAPGGQHDVRSR
jgi:hypothetical protein